MNHIVLFLRCCLTLVLLVGSLPASAMAGDPFPSYACIQDNVAFWKRVYSQHSSSSGLLHDSENLAIIYEVVTLEEGRDQANERLVKAAKEKYRQMLTALAQGRPPTDPEEKRVLALFGPSIDNAALLAAAENIRFQRCLSDRFQAGLVRSGRYLGQIKDIFNQYGLPSDLAYLPHVESSFNYQAYSKSGAAGIWQFIRATGSRFLTINAALDERRDPILATHAAAKFLQGNYRKLESWPLALTAYNHGLTSMLRAKNSLGSYEKIYHHYDGPRFGFASRNFYAEFLAAREIATNYRQYFKDLRLDEPVSTKVFAVNRAAQVKELADHFKVDLVTLAELNPAIRESVWSGQRQVPKGYSLRLPKTAGGGEGLAALPPPASSPAAPEQKSTSRLHRVKRGETIGAIAGRYGVSQQDLVASNGLGSRQLLAIGQELRIPVAAAKRGSKKTKVRVAQKNATGG